MKRNTFKMPNKLITDKTLTYSARRLGAVLYSRRNALGFVTKSLTVLAKLSNSSVATVRSALNELEAAEYIQIRKNFTYSDKHGRLVYGKTTYAVNLRFTGSFTMMTRDIFKSDLTHSAFCVYMYIALCAGNKKRAFPSATTIATGLAMSEASVHRAVSVLSHIKHIAVNHCIKRNQAYSNNIYYLVTEVITACKQGDNNHNEESRSNSSTSLYYYFSKGKNIIQSFLRNFFKGGGLKISKLSWYLNNEETKRGKKKLFVLLK